MATADLGDPIRVTVYANPLALRPLEVVTLDDVDQLSEWVVTRGTPLFIAIEAI